jgi:hypothetical protein
MYEFLTYYNVCDVSLLKCLSRSVTAVAKAPITVYDVSMVTSVTVCGVRGWVQIFTLT